MDGFFGIGIQELVLIAIVALIVLGPERLPATFREIAKFIRQVRNMTSEFTTQFGDDFKALEDLDPRRILQRELASIDEEEQAKDSAAKGKTTPAKTTTTTTPKPTQAKATTPKTTPATNTTATAKSTTTSTAAKSTPSTTTPTTTATTTEAPAAQADSPAAASPSPSEAAPTSASQGTTTPEPENRIAPPALTPAPQPAHEVAADQPTNTTVVTAPTNGVPPKEAESTTASDVVTST